MSSAEREDVVRRVAREMRAIVEEGWTRMDEQVCRTMLDELERWATALEGAAPATTGGGANTKTAVGGWIKAVFMQEGNLPTVADCCRLAALVEHALWQRTTEREEAIRVLTSKHASLAEIAHAKDSLQRMLQEGAEEPR
jgi:hypothetical protein